MRHLTTSVRLSRNPLATPSHSHAPVSMTDGGGMEALTRILLNIVAKFYFMQVTPLLLEFKPNDGLRYFSLAEERSRISPHE